jgi:hypothetical protein
MDITFLILRWLVIFTGYFLIGLGVGFTVSYIWFYFREKKAHKELMKEILSKRK